MGIKARYHLTGGVLGRNMHTNTSEHYLLLNHHHRLHKHNHHQRGQSTSSTPFSDFPSFPAGMYIATSEGVVQCQMHFAPILNWQHCEFLRTLNSHCRCCPAAFYLVHTHTHTNTVSHRPAEWHNHRPVWNANWHSNGKKHFGKRPIRRRRRRRSTFASNHRNQIANMSM